MTRRKAGTSMDADRIAPDLQPLPDALLADPLAYISAEHSRHRLVCSALGRFASALAIEKDIVGKIVVFLLEDLPIHYRDEDEDLFPLLRLRGKAADNLGPILSRLAEEHQASLRSSATIAKLLARRLDANDRVSRRVADLMLAYASEERRHLAIENGIVMVIARKRLNGSDLAALSRGMRARRGGRRVAG